MINTVVFDLGNVLIDFNYSPAAKRISSSSDKNVQEIYDYFFNSEVTGLFEEGLITADVFFERVKKGLNLRLNFKEFLSVWNEVFFLSQKNLEVYHIIRKLKSAYTVALLSNTNVLHFDYLHKTFPVFDIFDHLLLSYELKLKKPDPKIYQKSVELLKAIPQEIFYTDDRPELIEQAKGLGWHAFVFKGTAQLKEDLRRSGILL